MIYCTIRLVLSKFCCWSFFAPGEGFPLYPEIFYFIHNDPAAHQDHCGRCRIRTRELCPSRLVRYYWAITSPKMSLTSSKTSPQWATACARGLSGTRTFVLPVRSPAQDNRLMHINYNCAVRLPALEKCGKCWSASGRSLWVTRGTNWNKNPTESGSAYWMQIQIQEVNFRK